LPDNVYIDSGVDTPVSTDYVNIGGTDGHVQRVKLVDGTNNGTSLISGDSTYGLDVDVTRLPYITLNSQANPFTTSINVAGTFWQAVQPVSISGGTLSITGGSILVTGDFYPSIQNISGSNLHISTLPNVTLASQDSPFTSPISISGFISQDGIWNISGSNLNIANWPAVQNVSGSNLYLAQQNSPFTTPIDVSGSNLNVTLISQSNPFTTPIDVTGIFDIDGSTIAVTGGSLPVTGIFYPEIQNVSGSNLNISTLPSITLASQVSPFTSPLNVSGAINQNGIWNINTLSTITDVVHIDDNSSSITIDGTVSINGGTVTVTGESALAITGSIISPSQIKIVGGRNYAVDTYHDLGVDSSGRVNVVIGQSVPVYSPADTEVLTSGRNTLWSPIVTEETSSGWIVKSVFDYDRIGATDVVGVYGLNVYILNSGGQAGFLGMAGSYNGQTIPLSVNTNGQLNTIISGSVDVAVTGGTITIGSITAGDNNIGNVDIVTMPSVTVSSLPSVTIGTMPNEGQQTMAGSISVAIASNQSTLPVDPVGLHTIDGTSSDGQMYLVGGYDGLNYRVMSTNVNGNVIVEQSDTFNIIGTVNGSTVAVTGGSLPVTGTFWQSIQNVSGSNLNIATLPTVTFASQVSPFTTPINVSGSNLNLASQASPFTTAINVSGTYPNLHYNNVVYSGGTLTTSGVISFIPATASNYTYITDVMVTCSHATVGSVVQILEGSTITGNVLWLGYAAPAGGGFSHSFSMPRRTSNTNIEISARALTTASNVEVNINGFKSTI